MTVNKSFFNKAKEKLDHPTHAFVDNDEEVVEKKPLPVYKPVRRSRETKSKRLNLLITPSLYEAMLAKAESLDLSFNEACNMAINEFARRK